MATRMREQRDGEGRNVRRRLMTRMVHGKYKGLPKRNDYKIAKKVNLMKDLHYHHRYTALTDITTLSTITSAIGAGLTFNAVNLPNWSEFSNLYDQYKIVGVEVRFRLMTNPDSSTFLNDITFSQGANFFPKLWWSIDKDDNSTPTVATIRERGSAKCAVLKPSQDIKVYIAYPRVQLGFTGQYYVSSVDGMWLRCQDVNGATHFGLKVVLDKMGYAGNTFTVGIDYKYVMCFKNSK